MSLDTYRSNLSNPQLPQNFYQDLLKNKLFKEAIFLASPNFIRILNKYDNNSIDDSKKRKRIEHTLLKYYSRISTRPTPFGLFAGCSIGTFSEMTNLTYLQSFDRNTSLDMNFLASLSKLILDDPDVKANVKWFPNTSLYKVGDQYRLINYSYSETKKRKYSLEGIMITEYLAAVLKNCKNGLNYQQIISLLLEDKSVQNEEATSYIDTLIKNRILVSELEPNTSGNDFFLELKKHIFVYTKKQSHWQKRLTLWSEKLTFLDASKEHSLKDYNFIEEEIEQTHLDIESPYYFQVDSYPKMERCQLNKKIAYKLLKALPILCKLNYKANHTTPLDKFKTSFVSRYGDQEIPLSLVLDVEIGIGYNSDSNYFPHSPLVDDIRSSTTTKHAVENFSWSKIDTVLHEKLKKALNEKADEVTLEDKDFESIPIDWNLVPETFSAMIEVLSEDATHSVSLLSMGGNSANNLLGRFSAANKEVKTLSKAIASIDKKIHSDKILAEIVHLPEERTGNILHRVHLSEYEIPYLGRSTLPLEKQIPLEDLYICIRKNQVFLKSKKHNKQVIPRLSNAHNYTAPNNLPIYNFLCDLQQPNKNKSLGFHWSGFFSEYEFLPRVVYNDIVLSKTRWKFETTDFLSKFKNSFEDFSTWKHDNSMPDWVQLVEGDNTILLNLKNKDSFEMLTTSIINKTVFYLEEFLFGPKGLVKNDRGESFANQVIIPFYNKQKTEPNDLEYQT